MRVSVVLATFNGERHLQHQLDSYTTQELRPDELVVCDDASTDGTWAILEEFADKAPFTVRMVRNQRNLGFGRNFAQALGLASGDVIFMSDQDDVWLPRKLARMVAAFDEPRVLAVTCDQEMTDEGLQPSGQTSQGVARAVGASDNMFTIGCCTGIRASLRGLLLPLPAGIEGHDSWLSVLVTALDAQKVVPEVLQYHRRHGTNITADSLNPVTHVSRTALLRRWFMVTPDQKTFLYSYYDALVERLATAPAEAFPNADTQLSALRFAERKLAALRKRQALAELPRRRRIADVTGLWRAGDYRLFSGWRSVAKDLLAPRTDPG